MSEQKDSIGHLDDELTPPELLFVNDDERLSMSMRRMVHNIMQVGDTKDERVLHALLTTPRHAFVQDAEFAHADRALAIGKGQTISPPSAVGYMTEHLDPKPTDRVLEIGTGSGYQSAVLSPLVKDVYSIEIHEELASQAADRLAQLGRHNVHIRVGDGFAGWPEQAPFDKIIVTCSPEQIPPALLAQLKEGGRMLIPTGERFKQALHMVEKHDGQITSTQLRSVLFVPMTGTAEDGRQVLPDGSNPTLQNGDFAHAIDEDGRKVPEGWHNPRQAQWMEDAEGSPFVRFTNIQPGADSQILQAFPVDGTAIHALELSMAIRAQQVEEGKPFCIVYFYDDQQNLLAEYNLPFEATDADWHVECGEMDVPQNAAYAFVGVGLLGATGTLDVSNVKVAPLGA